ncbi:hypothetical protein D3C71_1129080 [compost metagenome]
MQVGLYGSKVQALEFFCVIETVAHGIGERGVLVQGTDIELVWPPVGIATALGRGSLGVVKRALVGLLCHEALLLALVSSRCYGVHILMKRQ